MNNRGVIHFVGLFGDLGGTEKATLEEMLMLREAGYQVIYTCITPMGRFSELLDQHDFAWASCNYHGPMDILSFWRIWKRINAVNALRIILVAHNVFAMLCCLFQGKRSITYMRHHYHHFGIGTIPRWKWLVTYAIASVSVRNIAYVCNYIRNEAIRIWPGLQNRSCVIYNIFRMQREVSEEEKRAARERFGIPQDAFVIGGAGRFEPVKRWDVWCEVAEAVLEQDVRSIALVVGTGSQESPIQRSVDKYPGRFVWAGVLTEMEQFYKAIDVLLFVSDFDATPRVPMEALTWGRPAVISLQGGGLFEVLPEQGCFKPTAHDVDTLVEKIQNQRRLDACTVSSKEMEHVSPSLILTEYNQWLSLKS